MSNDRRVVYQRVDKKWAWRLVVNDNIVATDGGQGYENEADARAMADRVIGGEFKNVSKRRKSLDD